MGFSRRNQRVICLREIFEEYVWRRYLCSLGKPKRYFAKKEKYDVHIDWNCLSFEHNTSVSVDFESESDVLDSINFSTSVISSSRRSEQSDSYISADSDVGAPLVLCSSKFENQRRKRRWFKLCAQKDTPVSVALKFKEYFTLDTESNLKVDLPKNIIPGDKDEHSFLVTDASCQIFSNTFRWHVNSGVIVKGCHKVRASCVVHEQEKTADVEVQTKLSKKASCFPITITRKSDHKIVYTCIITDLAEVFRAHTSPNVSIESTVDDGVHVSSNVHITSRGSCKATGWTDQQIIVASEHILEFTV